LEHLYDQGIGSHEYRDALQRRGDLNALAAGRRKRDALVAVTLIALAGIGSSMRTA